MVLLAAAAWGASSLAANAVHLAECREIRRSAYIKSTATCGRSNCAMHSPGESTNKINGH